MSRVLKYKWTLSISLFLFAVIICYGEIISYGFSQLKGQLHIVMNATPVEKVLSNPDTPADLKEKLKYISEVRKFGIDSLGLHDSKNYTSVFDQHDKPVIWVVTGCRPFELKEKKWFFPVIGSMPYKGFFNEELATEEARKINREGYESDIYSPSAWSTLGYFNDPILTGMLKRGPGGTAELIIHELTHATIFKEGDADRNENVATLIGEEGAIRFLKSKYGINSPELQRYHQHLEDDHNYSTHMIRASKRLENLYRSFNNKMTYYKKCQEKYLLITKVLLEINQLPLHNKKLYLHDFVNDPLPDNPFFMSYLRYRKDQSTIKKLLAEKYHGDLTELIQDLKRN